MERGAAKAEEQPREDAAPFEAARIEELEHPEHFDRCEALQAEVWGMPDRELVPAHQMRAAVHAGGLLAGAFVGDTLVGFSYGFPSWEEAEPLGGGQRRPGLHSHMLGVRPEYRQLGLGQALKWFQRDWALARGLGWISWTFDPLRARNAKLNLEHLGAVGARYHIDFYGEMHDALNGGLPSDRLLALWELDAPEVAARRRDGPPPMPDLEEVTAALDVDDDGRVGDARLDLEAPRLLAATPRDLTALLREDGAQAERWHQQLRLVLDHYLARGYRARRFVAGRYLLELRE